MTWNPEQYHRFKEARSAPAHDLQALIPDLPYARIVDLGCGTGEQAAALARRFPQADVLGLDSSAEMLAKAGAQQLPNLHFEQGDIAALGSQKRDGEYDLIYSNAALQWLPDHPRLLAQIWAHLRPGGVLAVQVPANHSHPSHALLTEVAQDFATELGGYTRFGPVKGNSPVLSPAEYAELLDSLGGTDITAISKVYPVVLAGAEGIVDWVRGTALVPYLSRLGEADGKRFVAAYLARLKEVFPGQRVYYAFTRVLFVARRPA